MIKWYRRLSLRQITVAIMRATVNVIHFMMIVCTYRHKLFDCKSIHYVIEKHNVYKNISNYFYLKMSVVSIQIFVKFLQI